MRRGSKKHRGETPGGEDRPRELAAFPNAVPRSCPNHSVHNQKHIRGVDDYVQCATFLSLFFADTGGLTGRLVVNNASWSPLYDLRATSRRGKPSSNVHLHYRANLSQSTGEDWNDAQLTLSTRAPEDLDGGIPKTSTVHIQETSPKRYVPSFPPSVSTTPVPCHADNLT